MLISPATKKKVPFISGQIINWDKHFCHVAECLEVIYPNGRVLNVPESGNHEETVIIDDQGELVIPAVGFGFIIQTLVSEQPQGQEGFLPTDGCLARFRKHLFRLVYSPKGEDTCGWSLSGPVHA